ncbi:hypothetical protein BAUCODRAFT_578217 [Baudoinia panamericana UAMH 10762]|uniref:Bromo domain-containing protein n=1 Tax=Baudoinia panamericana (strain UAMH 10762) TaxID=717646 RepID=M2LMD0_BAUPA|nr:uncharacterized protein BAUCODRAFT_578217 [Baudoinia panamericana UAMH 10762]EMC95472.1 hypothetical protein BAUCODRAFT_578217 [Baudoinia panamericana UAMH 10762]
MEAGKKRKAANAITPSSEGGSASKKLKLLNSNHASTTVTSSQTEVQVLGLRLVKQLREQKDKHGRYVATQFLTLPPRKDIPEYYEFTKLPLALDIIERKLHKNAYPTMTALESDLKRMIQNAKDYNDPNSEIYEDAERIRKVMYNYMRANNPAYRDDPNYSAFATPLPTTDGNGTVNGTHAGHEEEAEDVRDVASAVRRSEPPASKYSEAPSDRKPSMAPSAATPGDDDDGGAVTTGDLDLTGFSFQDAQQKIITHLLHYSDNEEGLEIYTPFANLPTRKLEDYYQLIKHPVSLKGVLKRTKGIHGRAPPTGVSDFKTWDAFEEEVSFIWRNAQEYNESGSEMFNLADELKEHVKQLLANAREKVEEPAGPRIKLGGPKPKVTLNLAQHRGSPTPGVHVDNEALLRQKQMVAAGVNGQQARPSPMVNGAARSSSQVPTLEPRPQSSAHSGSPLGGGIKAEKMPSQSPALTAALPAALTNGMMPPPAVRGSPFPMSQPTSSYNYTSLLPPLAVRPYDISMALLPSVTVSTHPQLPIPKRFSTSIPAHDHLSTQSTTITLPNSHYFLQIAPTISKQLSMGRPYKLFVTLNGVRLNQRDTQFDAQTGRRTHVYEGSLMQGVNRLEVEVAASKVEGGEKGREKEGLDVEKVTVFANLMKA